MNLKEAVEYRKLGRRRRPKDIILAANEPLAIDEIILYDKWRVRITAALTAEEYHRRLARNLASPTAATGDAPVVRNRAVIEESHDITAPPASHTHYYEARLHGEIEPEPPQTLAPWSKLGTPS